MSKGKTCCKSCWIHTNIAIAIAFAIATIIKEKDQQICDPKYETDVSRQGADV